MDNENRLSTEGKKLLFGPVGRIAAIVVQSEKVKIEAS